MPSYGYRFDTADRSIVISGDTNPAQATIDACRGCDVLIHEVLTHEWLAKRPDFQAYAAQFHATTTQLTQLAKQAWPRQKKKPRVGGASMFGGEGGIRTLVGT
jgi:ribonuclease BN (tRNA processing enzyme)